MISLTTADSALKNVYLDVITNQLNNKLDPFYAKIDKTTQDVAGNEVKKLVALGINGGIGAGSEIGSLPTSHENNYLALTSKLKNLYGTIEISDKALRASRSEAGAFLNLLNAEMENLIESSRFNFRRMLYGDGSGYLGSVNDDVAGSNVYEVTDPYRFVVGMRLDGYTEEGTPLETYQNQTVLDVNYEESTITLPIAVTEELELEPIRLYFAGSRDKEFIGLEGVCNANIKEIYGIDRTNISALNALNESYGTLTITALMKTLDNLKLNSNSTSDFIISSYHFRQKLQEVLKQKSMNTDITMLEGGFRSITFNGMPVYTVQFVEDGCAYILDSSVWHMHQLCDWTWLTNNKGEVLHQREGYPTHVATLVKYCDLICNRPNTIAKVKSI